MLDMVFSDAGNTPHGFTDSNHGKAYHVPITGAPSSEPPLHIVHVAVEMAPVAKVAS